MIGPKTSLIRNGPSRFGAIFIDSCFSLRFWELSQILSSFRNVGPFPWILPNMCLLANLCAARASVHPCASPSSLSLVSGNLVCEKEIGIAWGEVPNMSSNDVRILSACRLLL